MRGQGRPHAGARAELEVLVEEQSMRDLLSPHLSRWLADRALVRVRAFQGRPDLLKNLPTRMAGYAATHRRNDALRVLVLVDRDQDDCVALKRQIEEVARRSGLPVGRSASARVVVARVVVRELENWYFGDWTAVRAAFPKVRGEPPGRYRSNADADHVKTSTAFRDTLVRVGIATAAKPEWARRIGPHLDPDRNTSPSFRAFISGAQELVGGGGEPSSGGKERS